MRAECAICGERISGEYCCVFYGSSSLLGIMTCAECFDVALLSGQWKYVDVYYPDRIETVMSGGSILDTPIVHKRIG